MYLGSWYKKHDSNIISFTMFHDYLRHNIIECIKVIKLFSENPTLYPNQNKKIRFCIIIITRFSSSISSSSTSKVHLHWWCISAAIYTMVRPPTQTQSSINCVRKRIACNPTYLLSYLKTVKFMSFNVILMSFIS